MIFKHVYSCYYILISWLYHLCYMFFNKSTWTQLVYILEYGLIWAVFPSVFFCNTLLYLKHSHITCANIEEKYLEVIQDMHVWINERSRSFTQSVTLKYSILVSWQWQMSFLLSPPCLFPCPFLEKGSTKGLNFCQLWEFKVHFMIGISLTFFTCTKEIILPSSQVYPESKMRGCI